MKKLFSIDFFNIYLFSIYFFYSFRQYVSFFNIFPIDFTQWKSVGLPHIVYIEILFKKGILSIYTKRGKSIPVIESSKFPSWRICYHSKLIASKLLVQVQRSLALFLLAFLYIELNVLQKMKDSFPVSIYTIRRVKKPNTFSEKRECKNHHI